MNDDPYLTEVLYAKIIDQDEILQRKSYSPASPCRLVRSHSVVFDQLSLIIFSTSQYTF